MQYYLWIWMVIIGYVWLLMVIECYLWLYIVIIGYVWLLIVIEYYPCL